MGANTSGSRVAWSPDNTRILTASNDGARIWDTTTGKQLHRLTGHHDWVRNVAWSHDSTRVLTESYDGTIRLWDAESAQPLGIRLVSCQTTNTPSSTPNRTSWSLAVRAHGVGWGGRW
jgi:WD40 repeat protein